VSSTTLGAPGGGGSRLAPRRLAGLVAGWLDRPMADFQLVIGTSALLVLLGLVMVLSASSVTSYATSGSSFAVVEKQAMWLLIGLPAFVVALHLPVRLYRVLAYPLLGVALLLLLAVLVPGIGAVVNGARRWVALPGGFELQPSEPAKLALVIWGADLLARKDRMLHRWRHLMIPLMPVTLLLAALVMAEPDMGTTIVLVTISCALLWVAGAPAALFAGTGVAFGSLLGALAVAAPYRLARLTGFLDPCRKVLTTGYQACQGLYALSSGGWWGVGLGASREKWFYLPNQYTDYIFAIIGEELGLAGTLSVLLLFGVLTFTGLRIAVRNTDPFARLTAAGITAWLGSQALVNIGYVAGVLPVTGIPLPMVSFGGSSLVPTLFAIGMLASFARRPLTAPRRAVR
jgi:cell division protein FtsW